MVQKGTKSKEIDFKQAVEEVLPKEESAADNKPRLKTPTIMQALMLPFFKVPKRDGVTPNWSN